MSSGEFDWDEYLALSQSLIRHITNEAAYRVVASRAYYAAYWKARLLLEANRVACPPKNMHKFVWEALGLTWDADGFSIGRLGEDLKQLRVWADYKSLPRMTKTDAEKAIIQAEELVESIRQISSAQLPAIKTRAALLLLKPEYA